MKLRSAVHAVFVLLFVLLLADCSGHKQTGAKVPPPPAIESAPVPGTSASSQPLPGKAGPVPERGKKESDALSIPADAKPILVDTGLASWYGAPYHNRHGSNGEVYNMNAMTAAHRTLPLGSIVRVTNVKTGHSAIVRITDRGPFVEGRILDLSLAAAKKVDVWQPGIAAVRMEVLRTPSHSPRAAAGRCRSEPSANRMLQTPLRTACPAVITPPRFCVLAVRSETGGCASECKMTIAGAPKKLHTPRKPRKAVFSWLGWTSGATLIVISEAA